MQAFRDNAGRQWVVQINVTAVKRCRALLKSDERPAGVDLYGLVGDGFEGLGKLLADPVTLVDVLYILSDAAAAGVSDEDFGRAMGGDVIRHAADAFLAELVDFFPQAQREALKKVLEAARATETALAAHLAEVAAGIDPAAIAAGVIAETRRKASASNGSSGNAPASSASTPDLLRSAS
jgi:hypothetical protein